MNVRLATERKQSKVIKSPLEKPKANKKLAKQFGSTPIELQQKYGNDREHEEHLKKQQIREEEEADRLSSELRGSVVKALERKKVIDKIASAECLRNGPYRKTQMLSYFRKEDSPGPSTSCVVEGKSRKIDKKVTIKRRLPPTESNFSSLMKKAEAIQSGKISPSPSQLLASPPARKKISHNELIRRDIREIKYDRESKTKLPIESDKDHNEGFRFTAELTKTPPSVSSGSSFAPPLRRYLPGDIRYKGPPPERSQKNRTDSNLSSTDKTNMKESNKKDVQARGPRRINEENLARAYNRRQDPSRRMMSREEAISRFKTHERMRLEERRRLEQMRRIRDDDSDEDVDDEEYDSEMDDFIDDSEFDEHLKRGDLEETLRLINPRYDKNRWKLRERMIDDRHMEASYRDIAREEKRSSRIGLIEDIREAQCGKSIAL
ncbi:hypothetical protein DINM_020634 [Dirofilaria immitis]|nr:hypothetical protein [Dirofilaria immitis]